MPPDGMDQSCSHRLGQLLQPRRRCLQDASMVGSKQGMSRIWHILHGCHACSRCKAVTDKLPSYLNQDQELLR